MKLFKFIFLLFFSYAFAQKEFPIIIKDSIRDVLIDDYENIYVYRNSDLSILKYDSLGHKKAQVMFPQPFKIQSVENPLNIFLFSENGQEIKILDQNLNEIQYLNLYQKFGHVKAVYSQDLQFIWVLDSARKQLIQYNYREDKIINIFYRTVRLRMIFRVSRYFNMKPVPMFLTDKRNQFISITKIAQPYRTRRNISTQSDNMFDAMIFIFI